MRSEAFRAPYSAVPAPGTHSTFNNKYRTTGLRNEPRTVVKEVRRRDLVWFGTELRLHSKRGRLLATIERDRDWPSLWRLQLPGGQLSDLANISRIKDAAAVLALVALNGARQ